MTGYFDDLLATALVGTERRPYSAAGAPTPLAGRLSGGSGDPAGTLLDAAALATVYRRAGIRPSSGVPLPAPAPDETRPLVSERAGRRLATLLDGGNAELLTEWLSLADARGQRAPATLLPGLLERGRHDASLRPLIVTVGGHRLRWLAAHSPHWKYLAEVGSGEAADEQDWQFGEPGRRLDHLRAVRGADPAAGRQKLAAVWSAEDHTSRALLLTSFEVGLSTDDEEFLEKALNDRRKEVRVVAVRLLGQLPGSAYQQRMSERALRYVQLDDKGRTLVLSTPDTCDAAMRRDGLIAQKQPTVTNREEWLREIITAAPLSTWQALQPDPKKLLALKVSGPGDVLLEGLARATVRERDPAWAVALLSLPKKQTPGWLANVLLPMLPAERRTRFLVDQIKHISHAAGIANLLDDCPGPWDVAVGLAVLATLRRQYPKLGYHSYRWVALAGPRLPVALANETRALVEKASERGYPALEELGTMITLRQQMHEEFA